MNPSGKLPLTFYHDVSELPDFTDYSMENRTYRYFTGTSLYPFGYGLSYTDFEVTAAELSDNEVEVSIRNTGSMDGETVVQVYAACDSPFAPRHPRLCGFRRAAVRAGETKTERVKLDRHTREVVDAEGERRSVEHGILYVGLNQPDPRSAELTGQKPIKIRF